MFGGSFTAQTGTLRAATSQLRYSTLPECLWALLLGVLLVFFASPTSADPGAHSRSTHPGSAHPGSAHPGSAGQAQPSDADSEVRLWTSDPQAADAPVLSFDPSEPLDHTEGAPVLEAPVDSPAAPTLAAQLAVGMCGERGESTKAPPIIYPSVTATATGCTAPEMSLTKKTPGTPTQLAERALDVQQEQAVLFALPCPAPRSRTRSDLPTSDAPCIREHDARVPRPPQFGVPARPHLS